MNQSIVFLGCGNMGSALIHSIVAQKMIPLSSLRICDRNPEKISVFAEQGVQVSQYAQDIIPDAHYVVLAVKPQVAGELLDRLQGSFHKDAVLISIAAGLSVQFLQEKSGLSKVIRVMPNTPVIVQMGVSAVFFPEKISQEERDYVQGIFESFSIVIPCETEEKLNQMTLISGCGPAYFFRILEILSQQAQDFGFSKEIADSVVLQTLRGAGELAYTSADDFSTLREKVTSKKGITQAVLDSFSENGLEDVMKKGMQAGWHRTQELIG